MAVTQALDISHLTFLDLIRAVIAQSGAVPAKGTLIRMALKVADQFTPVDFATVDDFVAAIEGNENPISTIEGHAVHLGGGVFGLPKCPFRELVADYKSVFGNLPEGYAELMEVYNKGSQITDQLKIGEGAGVSPFCLMHQPMRSALGGKITIGGKPITVYQLGCKSGGGEKAIAEKWVAEAGADWALVEQALDANMCCYAVKMQT